MQRELAELHAVRRIIQIDSNMDQSLGELLRERDHLVKVRRALYLRVYRLDIVIVVDRKRRKIRQKRVAARFSFFVMYIDQYNRNFAVEAKELIILRRGPVFTAQLRLRKNPAWHIAIRPLPACDGVILAELLSQHFTRGM